MAKVISLRYCRTDAGTMNRNRNRFLASAPGGGRASEHRFVAVGVLMVLGGLVGWLWWRQGPADEDWGSRRLRIGYAIEAPYAFVDATGRVTGEGPEIARVIAGRLGLGEPLWRQTEFGVLLDELESGRIDVIAAGMFITPEREKRVAFSQPTFVAEAALLVARGNPLALHSYDDLVAKGVRVVVLANSVEERALKWRQRWPAGRLIVVSTADSAMEAMAAGRADAFVLSAPSLRWAAAREKDAEVELAVPFRVPAEFAAGAMGGFAFRRDDQALRRRWDGELQRFIGSPEHLQLVQSFGFDRAQLPDRLAAAAP